MKSKIKVRKPNYSFKETLPKHWMGEEIFKAHFGNTLTLIFPGAEKFFVRSIKNFIPNDNEELKKEILGFIGQETQHSIQHEKLWDILRNQGYEIDTFLNYFHFLGFEVIEKLLSNEMKISVTAGLEHYTAMLAELALEHDAFESADPEMKELFEWHCMEELEHKSVAFDALINSNPDYFHRIAGMIIATILFMKFSGEGILQFAFQDKQLFDSSYWEDALDFLFFKESILNKGIEKFLRYFSHDFHPSRVDTDHLLEKYNKRDKSAA